MGKGVQVSGAHFDKYTVVSQDAQNHSLPSLDTRDEYYILQNMCAFIFLFEKHCFKTFESNISFIQGLFDFSDRCLEYIVGNVKIMLLTLKDGVIVENR